MSQNRVITFILLALIAAGCERKAGPPVMPPSEVAIVTVAPERIVLTTELPGRTSPFLIAEIRPQVNGLLQKRLFTEGADVKAGDVLYQIDSRPYDAAVKAAEAMAIKTKADWERSRNLLEEKTIAQQEYDLALASYQAAEAALEEAKINQGYCRIVSPISGRIGASSVTEGAIVTAYQPVALATIQQLDPIYVDVPQSTADLLRLRRRLADGQLIRDGKIQNAVQLILEDGTKYTEEGTLQFQDVSVEPSTATVTLRMVFPNPNGILLPGMFVRAAVKEGVNEKALLIPQQAVMRDPKGNPMVMLVNATGVVEPRMLTIDRAVGDKWLVTSGLAVGDKVVVEGLQKIRPGAPVKVVPEAANPPTAK
jgi:membrane fusion protein, multidrug efflux system